jgi:hypothetical protein
MVSAASEAIATVSAEVDVEVAEAVAVSVTNAANAAMQIAMTRTNAARTPKHEPRVKTQAIAAVASATSARVSEANVVTTPTTANLQMQAMSRQTLQKTTQTTAMKVATNARHAVKVVVNGVKVAANVANDAVQMAIVKMHRQTMLTTCQQA